MKGCNCEIPQNRDSRPGFAPERSCVKCGRIIPDEYTSCDETVIEFFDRLTDTFPGEQPAWFSMFMGLCMERERDGRTLYGHRHMGKDNASEGMEEAADGALYAFFTILRNRRDGNEEEWGLALTAAKHFAEAYQALRLLRDHTGSPALSDDPDTLP